MDVLNVNEVAEYLNCSVSNIRKMVRNNTIPYFRIGNRLNFKKESIDLWVHNQEVKNMQPTQDEYSIKSIREHIG